jgi:glycosyltransferase involved in cell wall biosynthesis
VFLGSALTTYVAQLATALPSHFQPYLVLLEVDRQMASASAEEERLLSEMLPPDVGFRLMNVRRKRDPRSLLDVCRTAAHIRSLRPDVIHVQDPSDYRVWLMLKTVFRDVAVVSTVHDVKYHLGEEFQGRGERKFFRHALRSRANALIVHSDKLKQALLESNSSVPADEVYAIPHGTYSLYTRWQRTDVVEEDATVLFFGRIWPYKGLEYLIDAVPIVENAVPSIKVIIAGEGEDFARYRRMIHNPERFEIHNYCIPVPEVARLFQRSSVVALPYVEASQSGILALAYAFGKPVVVTDVGSLSETVKDGETGLIVPPRDVQGLAHALVRLLRNSELRQTMGRQAYEFGRSALGWRKIAEQTVQVYQGVAK